MDYIAKISEQLNGIEVPNFNLDGKIFRFGKKKTMWAIGYQWTYKDKLYWRVIGGDWSSSDSNFDLKSYEENELTKRERDQAEAKTAIMRHAVEIELAERREFCVSSSAEKIKKGDDASLHPYILKKKIDTFGVKSSDDLLQVPVYKNHRLVGLQFINKDSKKWFEPGTDISGSYFPLKPIKGASLVYLAEGFATAASIQMTTEHPVLCCFTANNMVNVAKQFMRPFSPFVIVCGDRDKINEQTGFRTGAVVSNKITQVLKKCEVIFPWDDEDKIGDFNDLHVEKGLEAVKKRIEIEYDEVLDNYFRKMEATGFTSYDETRMEIVYQYKQLLEYMSLKSPYWYFPELKSFYIYDGKIYKEYHEQFVKQYAQKMFSPEPVNDTPRTTFLNLVKATNCAKKEKIEVRTNSFMAFKNGVADFSDPKNPRLLPHNNKYFLTNLIPHNMNIDAECPTYDQMLKNLLEEEDLINTVNEFLGWTLSGLDYGVFQNFMIFDGRGENGKSTLCNIFNKVVGDSNTTSVSMSLIGQQRFAEEPLFNSMLNISEEEPPSVFRETGALKRLTGETKMSFEPKGKAILTKYNKSKIIVTYNKMPEMHDTSDGFQRRPLIIPFRFNLRKSENAHRLIPDIYKKIEGEYEGIIKRAMEGLIRLHMRGRFLPLEHTKEKLQEMYRESNSMIDFVEQHVEKNEEGYFGIDEICSKAREFDIDLNQLTNRQIMTKINDALKITGIETRSGVVRKFSATTRVRFGACLINNH